MEDSDGLVRRFWVQCSQPDCGEPARNFDDCRPVCWPCSINVPMDSPFRERYTPDGAPTPPRRPECWPLLDSARAVIFDKAMRPSHLCADMLDESVERWAGARLAWAHAEEATSNLPFPVPRWRPSAPLPAGKANPDGGARAFGDYSERAQRTFAQWAPFDDDVSLRLALVAVVAGTRVEVLGPDNPAPEAFDGSWRVWKPLRFIVTGDPTDEEVLRFTNAAKSWWRQFIGKPAGAGGRPRGREIGPDDLENARAALQGVYQEAWLEGTTAKRRVTNKDLADNLGVSESTIERVNRENRARARRVSDGF